MLLSLPFSKFWCSVCSKNIARANSSPVQILFKKICANCSSVSTRVLLHLNIRASLVAWSRKIIGPSLGMLTVDVDISYHFTENFVDFSVCNHVVTILVSKQCVLKITDKFAIYFQLINWLILNTIPLEKIVCISQRYRIESFVDQWVVVPVRIRSQVLKWLKLISLNDL